MLAKKYRFQPTACPDFFRRARRFRGQFIDILTLTNPNISHFQNILIVSKKTAHHAVSRNKLKRLFTPLLQQELKNHPDFWQHTILAITFKQETITQPELAADWQNYLNNIVH